jgi:membrane protein implicated in regulation of membrane protease activity
VRDNRRMDLVIVWVILAVVFGFGELHTNGFFLAPFAAGALIAAVAGLAGAGLAVTAIVFLVASFASLGLLRPVALRHRRMPAAIRTGTAALVGQRAIVVERIVNGEGVGCVKIGGEVWTARSYEDDGVIEAGRRVEVVEIRGATALVME